MQSLAIHPALWQLLRFQARGKVRKLRASFHSPRRQILSLFAVVLAVVWLGNAVASMLLREAYDPVTFGQWMSRSLLLYFFWHVIHTAYARPESALDWTPAEQNLLCGGPFSRREILTYRLMVIFSTTLPKAALVTFVLMPDLPLLATGFCGLLLGLVFLEFLRLILQTLACGMTNRQYLGVRLVIFGLVIGIAGYGLGQAVSLVTLDGQNHWQFLQAWASAIGALGATWVGQTLESPFRLFSQIILAPELSGVLLLNLSGAMLLLAASAHVSIRLDGVFIRRLQTGTDHANEIQDASLVENQASAWPRIFRLGGLGTIAWRQLHYALQHWRTLSVGLGVPAVLACLPLLVPGEGEATFLTVFAGVVFYSFVLLPAALKLDFRRDFDHLPLLKSLPLTAWAVVVGQLTTPVLLTWAFQISLLAFAAVVCQVSWMMAAGAIFLLLPMSIFFTALDNLIFLLYPHRLHQEGLEVFLRSTLTFTGKGLLLVAAVFGVMGWLTVARLLAQTLGQTEWFRVMFLAGLGCFAGLLAMLAVALSVWAYLRFDPTEI